MPGPPPDLLADFEARGLVHDTTDRDALAARLADGPITVYVGFDPTAPSLHVGHLIGQFALRRFQLAGHRVLPLAGGATGMVGDPSGRSEERNLLDAETLAANTASIGRQLSAFLDFDGANPATLTNNADWTRSVSALDFLRDVGKHVTVNQMLAKDSVRTRLQGDQGLSYTEFSYMLLQAFDFRWLAEHEGCELQMGGSDQWGNIVTGIELTRKALGLSVHGLTWPLLLKADGTKFGKSADGSVWLDPELTSPFRFHQFWIQTRDDEVRARLCQFSFRPVTEIDELVAAHLASPEQRVAQRALADEVTTLVHGTEAVAAANEAAQLLFSGGDVRSVSPAGLDAIAREVGTVELVGVDLVGAVVTAGLASSNGDARRAIGGNEIAVNGHKVADPGFLLTRADLLPGERVLLQRGRKRHAIGEIPLRFLADLV
jgi:tyrosyl-tRNA synthetase